MEALYGIILILGGLLLHFVQKSKSAGALLENQDANKKIDNINKDVIKNEALMEAEKLHREKILKEVDDLLKKGQSDEKIRDFYNGLPSDPSSDDE